MFGQVHRLFLLDLCVFKSDDANNFHRITITSTFKYFILSFAIKTEVQVIVLIVGVETQMCVCAHP